MTINYEEASQLLENIFAEAETVFLQSKSILTPTSIKANTELIFASNTQAYREVLLGCILARLLDRSINIRHPYTDQSGLAFSGRSLDEKVVNPFLHNKHIPSSKGPYLSVFRRSVKFDESTRVGLRDVRGYDAFLNLVTYLESTTDGDNLKDFLSYLLFRFIQLREESIIPLSKLHRISIEQYDKLIGALLEIPSGGRIPVLLIVATFMAMKELFTLTWEISWQGINVSDAASGAGGDITIKDNGEILFAAEVTERPVNKQRVLSTFNTKIASAGLEDYLFFAKKTEIDEGILKQIRQYFAQGHEIAFLEIKNWMLILLSTIGTRGRIIFNEKLLGLLDSPDISKTIKLKWNEQIQILTSI